MHNDQEDSGLGSNILMSQKVFRLGKNVSCGELLVKMLAMFFDILCTHAGSQAQNKNDGDFEDAESDLSANVICYFWKVFNYSLWEMPEWIESIRSTIPLMCLWALETVVENQSDKCIALIQPL